VRSFRDVLQAVLRRYCHCRWTDGIALFSSSNWTICSVGIKAYIIGSIFDCFSTIGRSWGKTTSTSFTGSTTKHEQSLHGNVKPLQLAANESSRLAYRSPALKNQWNLPASSSSTNVVTTFDDNEHVSSSVIEEKVGVLLLNLGGPETLDDVQPFLFNLFADPVSGYIIPNYHRHCNFPASGPVHYLYLANLLNAI
jgi:hypothetical protein